MKIIKGATYQHYKNRQYYTVIAFAKDSNTLQDVVVYQGEYDHPEFGSRPIWVRPYDEFAGTVEHEGKHMPRFTISKDIL